MIELFFNEFLSTFPFHILACVPFHKKLRHSPWKTFLPPYLVAKNRLGHKSREGTMERLFLCIINYIIEYRRREIFVVY